MTGEVYAVVDRWIVSLPEEATAERVKPGFWYVRIPGTARRWIPIELELGERSLKITSHVIVEPEENQAQVYALLLRHNHSADGVAFSFEGREGVICLVGRLPLDRVSEDELDAVAGRIVETTEETFRTILELGFGSRLRRSR